MLPRIRHTIQSTRDAALRGQARPPRASPTTSLVGWSLLLMTPCLLVCGFLFLYAPTRNAPLSTAALVPAQGSTFTVPATVVSAAQATPFVAPSGSPAPSTTAQAVSSMPGGDSVSSSTPSATPPALSPEPTLNPSAASPLLPPTPSLQPAEATATPVTTATSTPISTPTLPADTPDNTAPPTVTPIAGPAGWSFSGVRLQPDGTDGSLWVYGDMINNTGAAQAPVNLSGTFYDAQDQVVAGRDQTTSLWPIEVVPPGVPVPFMMSVSDIQEAARFDLSVEARATNQLPRQDFSLSDVDPSMEEGYYCVVGQLRNPGDQLHEYLVVVAVLYDRRGQVVNFEGYGADNPEQITGNQALDFKICIDPLHQTVDHYQLHAWGH